MATPFCDDLLLLVDVFELFYDFSHPSLSVAELQHHRLVVA